MKRILIISVFSIIFSIVFGRELNQLEYNSDTLDILYKVDSVHSEVLSKSFKRDSIYFKSNSFYRNNEIFDPGFLNRKLIKVLKKDSMTADILKQYNQYHNGGILLILVGVSYTIGFTYYLFKNPISFVDPIFYASYGFSIAMFVVGNHERHNSDKILDKAISIYNENIRLGDKK